MKNLLFACLLLTTFSLHAQSNVRAWYAQGQVWIVWQIQLPIPTSYTIYKSGQPFTNTSQANPIGRPFAYEYLPGTFIEQTGNPAMRYKIPMPDGSVYTLAENEGLFVETTLAPGSAYYAVVESLGNTPVTAGVNRTQNAVPYNYDPLNDPVNCHLQLTQTLSSGHKSNWYCLWALGRQEHWAGRPDFPVMANAFKNGMPGMFIVSEALNMDTSGGKRVPLTNWFHGGGGTAIQHTADKFKHVNIAPLAGISASHNDDFPQMLIYEGDTVFSTSRTLWFGWSKNHNPFNPGYDAGAGDTIINFTQRKILWINSWLVKNYRVNPDRIALQGYSMGSAGASALGKAFPQNFSTVCAFNNGFRSGVDPTSEAIVGSIAENLPTNLRGPNNAVVHINEVFDMNTHTSPQRDLPLFRTWAGKNDPNDRMHWGPDLVAQYRLADSLGFGQQISWDERAHTYETLGMHWIQDLPNNQQTFRDNLGFQEFFSRKQSFPAFFNHSLDPSNNDPGTGVQGINNGDGDNWGTWGGWHLWELNTVTDEPTEWSITAWLTEGATFANDNCPHDQLRADLAIRRPQQFLPAPGASILWQVSDLATGEILQTGSSIAAADGLVVLKQVMVYRQNIRKVRITVSMGSSTSEAALATIHIQPNPSAGDAVLVFDNQYNAQVLAIKAIGTNGRVMAIQTLVSEGTNRISLAGLATLPAGVYFLEIHTDTFQGSIKWVKI